MTNIVDVLPNGRGPIFQAKLTKYGTVSKTVVIGYHLTTGLNTAYHWVSPWFNADLISVRICDGGSMSSPQNCGAWKGPFHP